MSIQEQVDEIVRRFERDYAAGDVAWGEFGSRVWEILGVDNVDEVVAALPQPRRLELIQYLRNVSFVRRPADLITIFGGIRIETEEGRIHREEQEAKDKERVFAIAHAWAARNAVSLDEVVAAVITFVESFDAAFRIDWPNTRKHLLMPTEEESASAAKLLTELVGEVYVEVERHFPFDVEDIEDWGNRGALATALKRARAIGSVRRDVLPIATELLRCVEAVFRDDWAYTRSMLAAGDFTYGRTFLEPAREISGWGRYDVFIITYRVLRQLCDAVVDPLV